MQKISRLKKTKAIAAAMLLGLVSSCASQETSELPPELTSEAALLDESESATPIVDESAIFADLNGQPADSDFATSDASTSSDLSVTETSAASSDSPFYNPVGGESLGRVAYTLYGDRKQAASLLGKNPELSGVKTLSAEQRVYFDFAQVRPMPTYLTKDLIDRYPSELASKIQESGFGKESVTLGQGETLQELSMRLYGTTRYWTEIYLLNRDSISNYDRVPAGVTLAVYQRASVAGNTVAPEAPAAPAIVSDNSDLAPPATPIEEAPRSVAQPADPIPETPNYSAAEPAEVTHAPPPPAFDEAPAEVASTSSFVDFNNSANVRRVVYIALIVLIGAVAFYMTRSPKKKNFDMLDVTTSDTASARAKLKDSDNHHQGIG